MNHTQSTSRNARQKWQQSRNGCSNGTRPCASHSSTAQPSSNCLMEGHTPPLTSPKLRQWTATTQTQQQTKMQITKLKLSSPALPTPLSTALQQDMLSLDCSHNDSSPATHPNKLLASAASQSKQSSTCSSIAHNTCPCTKGTSLPMATHTGSPASSCSWNSLKDYFASWRKQVPATGHAPYGSQDERNERPKKREWLLYMTTWPPHTTIITLPTTCPCRPMIHMTHS